MTAHRHNDGRHVPARQPAILRFGRGFTLVEMAMVLLIFGLLLAGLIPTISSQIEQQRRNETRKTLEEMKDALLGFAVANGRLPCPASTASGGTESFCTSATTVGCIETTALQSHGRCAKPYDGFVPAMTLGIAPINAQGQLLDAWSNPVRYAITNTKDTSNNFYFTATDGIKTRWNSGISLNPDLRVCPTSTGLTTATPGSADCAGNASTNNAVAVIYSLGKNSATGGAGGDEAHNPNPQTPITADRAFVFHEPAASVATNGEFDDIVTWLSPNILYNRMVAAGKLP